MKEVLGRVAQIVDEENEAVIHRNTWGDGLYLVFRDVRTAMRAARRIGQLFQTLDLPSLGLPDTLGIRTGAHAGPVFEGVDPVTGVWSAFGSHVTRTARIEPITPEGEVYVTEPFAARGALEVPGTRCDYVGMTPTAKGYGTERMYRLCNEVTDGAEHMAGRT
jgi:class 3 adenylate cyclase